MSRLKSMYNDEIVEAMIKKFGYKNVMEVPKLDKIVINMGVGEAKDNSKALDAAAEDIHPEAQVQADRFELKHLDEKRSVSREEVIALAQKGLDYDRIRAKYDALRADQPERDAHEALLQELAAGSGQSVDALLRSLRPAQTGPEGEEAALSDPEAPAPAPERPEEPTLSPAPDPEADRRQSYLRFSREFPQVKAEEIPPEIWRDFAAGKGDLAYLYARHENRQLRSELTAARQNEENRRKSTGSRATVGSAMSKLDADWYDGT